MQGRLSGQHARGERLNAEPAIFLGCTAGELGALFAAAGVVWTPVSVALAYSVGYPVMGAGAAIFLIAVSIYFSALWFQRIKRGRPDAYYTQALHLWLVQRGLAGAKFINHHGWWSLGRSMGFSLESPRLPPEEKFPKP